MSKGKIVYYDANGVEKTYTFDRDFAWGYEDDIKLQRIVNTSTSGLITYRKIYAKKRFKIHFPAINEAQKQEFDNIKLAGMGWFYPDGDAGTGYYGLFTFSAPKKIMEGYYSLDMEFQESDTQLRVYTAAVKFVNNDNKTYTNRAWHFQLDTAALINSGQLDADGKQIRLKSDEGADLNFWYDPDTWNSTATDFWVKIPEVGALETVYVQIVMSSYYTENVASAENTFEYFEDWSGYTEGDLAGQNGWSVKKDAAVNFQVTITQYNGKKHLKFTPGCSGCSATAYKQLISAAAQNKEVLFKGIIVGSNTQKDTKIAAGFFDGSFVKSGYKYFPQYGYCADNVIDPDGVKSKQRLLRYDNGTGAELDSVTDVYELNVYFTQRLAWGGSNLREIVKQGSTSTSLSVSDENYSSFGYLLLSAENNDLTNNVFYIDYFFLNEATDTEPTVEVYQ